MYLVEAFVDVDHTRDVIDSADDQVLDLDGSLVPAVCRSESGDAGEHVWVGPGGNPRVHVSEADSRPVPIEGWEYEEHSVCHWVGRLGRVFGEEGRFGMKGVRGPGCTSLDGV